MLLIIQVQLNCKKKIKTGCDLLEDMKWQTKTSFAKFKQPKVLLFLTSFPLRNNIKIKRCCSQGRSEDVQRRADIQGIAVAMTHLTVQIVPVRVYALNPT